MKAPLTLIVASLMLASCSSPFAGPEQLDIGIANAAAMQPYHAAEASRAMAGMPSPSNGVSMYSGARQLRRLAPLQPIY